MNASGSTRTLPAGVVPALPAVLPPAVLDLPPPLTPRQQRRARLVARLARRRAGFLLLHVALGLAGWGLVALAITGAAALIR
ncbi:MAG: hypothetical protein KatS3mg127_1824 [Silanimonas sp.]|nr:MAG: hypothetical protein KatS3mg127_1824 [Silanimonas sp.]